MMMELDVRYDASPGEGVLIPGATIFKHVWNFLTSVGSRYKTSDDPRYVMLFNKLRCLRRGFLVYYNCGGMYAESCLDFKTSPCASMCIVVQ